MAKAFFTLLLLSLYLFSQSAESRNLLSTPNDGCNVWFPPISCYFPPSPPVTQTPPPSPTKDGCNGWFPPISCYFPPSPPATQTPPPSPTKDNCDGSLFQPIPCFFRPSPPSKQEPAPTTPPKDPKCKNALDFIVDCQTIIFHPEKKDACCQQADDYLQCFDDDFIGNINKENLRGIKMNTCSSSPPNTVPSPPSNQEPAPSTPTKKEKDPKCKNAILFIAQCELIGFNPQNKNNCCQQADEYTQCFDDDFFGGVNKQLLAGIKKSTCS